MYLRPGLGDVERAWQIRAEQPIRLAELAQRIAAGEGELEVPDTPENRAAVANQVVDAAIDAARELQALQAQGITYGTGATTNDPSTDYQWTPGQTPTIDQALAELAYTQQQMPEAPAFQAPDVPALLAEQQIVLQQQQAQIAQQAQQQAAQAEQKAQIDYQAQIDAAARANAEALAKYQQQLADQNAAAEKARAAQLAQQRAAVEAQLAAQLAAQQKALAEAQSKPQYDSAYNAAILAAQALKDFQAGGSSGLNSSFLDSGGDGVGGGKTIADAGASNDDLSYTGSAPVSPLMIGVLAVGAYFLLAKG